jgi:chromosome segregation ATPase
MNTLELVKELEAQRAENQRLRHELTQALERLEQASARIKQLEGQAAKAATTGVSPLPATGSKSPSANRRACEKRAAKGVAGSSDIEATP